MHTVQHFEGLQGPKTQTVQRFGGLQSPKWIQYKTLEPSRAKSEDSTTLWRPPGPKMQTVQHSGGLQGPKCKQYSTFKGCVGQKRLQYSTLETSRGQRCKQYSTLKGCMGQKRIQYSTLEASRPQTADSTSFWASSPSLQPKLQPFKI